MSGSGEYQKKLDRRAFSVAFNEAHNEYGDWCAAMLQENEEQALHHARSLVSFMIASMHATGMRGPYDNPRWHEGDE